MSGAFSNIPADVWPTVEKYPKCNNGDVVELRCPHPPDSSMGFASGMPIDTKCPSCEYKYWGPPRNPKTLIYHCAKCKAYFDILGEVFENCICRTGMMYIARRLK